MASGPRPPSDAASATAGATPYSDRVTPSSNGRRIRQQALGVPPADRTRADPSSASRSHRQTPSLVRIASSPHEHVCTMSAQRSPRRYLACDLCRAAVYPASLPPAHPFPPPHGPGAAPRGTGEAPALYAAVASPARDARPLHRRRSVLCREAGGQCGENGDVEARRPSAPGARASRGGGGPKLEVEPGSRGENEGSRRATASDGLDGMWALSTD